MGTLVEKSAKLGVVRATAIVVGLVAVTMGVRFLAHDMNPTFFVVASRPPATERTVPAGFVVQGHNGGYDGQYFYSLAVRPLQHLDRDVVPLDNPPYRQQRIGYPLLAWVVSAGSRAGAPWALIFVNLVAFGAIAFLLAKRADELRCPPILGAAIALAPGITFAVARDLSEPLVLALVLGAFAAARAGRLVILAVVASAAVLTRETAVLAIVAIVLGTWIDQRGRGSLRTRIGVGVALVCAVAVLLAWQLYLGDRWGILPVRAAGDTVGVPFVGAFDGLRTAFERRSGVDALGFVLLAIVVTFLVFAVAAARRSAATAGEKLLLVGTCALALCLGANVWVSFASFLRALDDAVVFGGIVVLGARGRVRGALWALPLAWLPLAGYLIARP